MDQKRPEGQQLALFADIAPEEEQAAAEEGGLAEPGALNELYRRSLARRGAAGFCALIAGCSRFRHYSIFNNLLVYLQDPQVTFVATAAHWQRSYKRKVKPDARPLIILAPRSPVAFVYDVADTEGQPLPEPAEDPFGMEGTLPPGVLQELYQRTLANCERYRIHVRRRPLSALHASSVTRRAGDEHGQYLLGRPKLLIEIDDGLDVPASYPVLVRELARIFLGHLGSDADGWWPDRASLPAGQRTLEAETATYLVSCRAGLAPRSAEHLARHVTDEKELETLDLNLLIRATGLLERMGQRVLKVDEGE